MAVRKAGGNPEAVRQVIRPVIFGALTTIGIFAVFLFSSVKGYNQLAFFSSLSIILCLLFSLFVLPHFLGQEKDHPQITVGLKLADFSGLKVRGQIWIFGWIVIMAAMIISGLGLRFNNDITQFDGAGKEVLRAEDDFHNTWGGKEMPAVFVVSGRTLEAAYQNNSDLYEAAIKNIGRDNFTSLAAVWPGYNRRKANLLRWQDFWSSVKESKLRQMLAEYGKVYNFSPEAFKPFFDQLHPAEDLETEPKGLNFFSNIKEQFVLQKEGGFQILSFFSDQDEYIARLSALSNNYPGSFVVSRKNFSRMVSRALSGELIFLACLAVFLTVALTFLLLKDMRLSVLALVPVLTSLVMIAGIIPLAGLALNMPSIIASMVVVGIVSDYGMFVVYYCKNKFNTGTYTAVTLAAVTTLIGAGVLLFAKHPVLFSIGVTLVTGVLSGYISSLIIIPQLYKRWIPVRREPGLCRDL
jgi:predicted exporter